MPYKIHRVIEKPAGTQWNTDLYTDEDRQIAEDYVTNVINVQPGYKGVFAKDYLDENTMKLSYTLISLATAQRFVKAISDEDNPYFANFKRIQTSTVRYRITTYIEDEDGVLTRHGPIINPDLTQT